MKRNIVIAVVTAAALVGGGTATALAVSGDDAPTTRAAENRAADDDGRDDDERDDERGRADAGDQDDDRDDRDDRDRDASSGDVTAADAIAAALKHTPGTAVSAELDDRVWEVDVLGRGDTWHSVRIDPGTGKVLDSSRDDEDDADEVRAALKGASVTAGEAAKAAAAKGTVVSVDLDDDDDRGWEAETRASGGDERDWRVDLGSGSVTTDRDDDGDDSDDSDDD
ncbi:PepSY domain-containing protein [Streptomyces sp. NPDC018955]|uniref:PepSY domain-containing protein n=1 Tax=Streptomyces sp. NPDC018955 TaxID=3365055 RepID=UPI0037964C71